MKTHKIFALVCLLVLTSCQSSSESEEAQIFLDKPYETFIAGILTPDTLRSYPQQIFVGRIDPSQNISAPRLSPIGLDTFVNAVLSTTRGVYRADITPYNNAQVFIIDESSQRIEFRHVGNGFYQDDQNRLRVISNRTYRIEVSHNGNVFTGQTTVPEQVRVSTVHHLDTVRPIILDSIPDVVAYRRGSYFERGSVSWILEWNRVRGAKFFRYELSLNDDPRASGMAHIYANAALCIFSFENTNANIIRQICRVVAIDSAWSSLYEPEDQFGFFSSEVPSWWNWFYRQSERKLSDRSTIRGTGNCAGVFGSYTQHPFTFWAIRPDTENNKPSPRHVGQTNVSQ
jgi:hypothetical protein